MVGSPIKVRKSQQLDRSNPGSALSGSLEIRRPPRCSEQSIPLSNGKFMLNLTRRIWQPVSEQKNKRRWFRRGSNSAQFPVKVASRTNQKLKSSWGSFRAVIPIDSAFAYLLTQDCHKLGARILGFLTVILATYNDRRDS